MVVTASRVTSWIGVVLEEFREFPCRQASCQLQEGGEFRQGSKGMQASVFCSDWRLNSAESWRLLCRKDTNLGKGGLPEPFGIAWIRNCSDFSKFSPILNSFCIF